MPIRAKTECRLAETDWFILIFIALTGKRRRLNKMPKAILELEKMPNACYGDGCPFFKITGICDILSSRNNYMPVLVPSEGKHPDCPLKEVEEDE